MDCCEQCIKDLFGGGVARQPAMMQQPMCPGLPPPGIQVEMQQGPPGWGTSQSMGVQGALPPLGMHGAQQGRVIAGVDLGMAMSGVGLLSGVGGQTIMTSQGLQPCFKCNGNGFCHTSSMDHDRGPNEKCFFCSTCDACGGRGAIPGGTATVQQTGMHGMGILGAGLGGQTIMTSQGLQPCFKCNGNGFCHMSSMDHDKGPNEKCFFCSTCDACGGRGAIPGGATAVHQTGMPGMGILGAGLGGQTTMTSQGLQPCFKCNGNGFCHTSSMDHDKGPNEKCFFCSTCDACGGHGAIAGGTTTLQQTGMGTLGAALGMSGPALVTSQGLQSGAVQPGMIAFR